MLRVLATLSLVGLAAGASSCDEKALKSCGEKPVFSKEPHKVVCQTTSAYWTCVANAGCITDSATARACTLSFSMASCDGVSICTPVATSSSSKSKPSSGGDQPVPVTPASGEEDPFDYEKYPPHAAFFGYIGATFALVFANLGAAYGTAKSGRGISTMGVLYPNLVMKHIIPVVMAGVLGIYGLIIAVIIGNGVQTTKNGVIPAYTAFKGFAHLGGGLACGLSGLAAGLAIGIVGDYGVRSAAEQPKLYVGMVLVLIFSEALGLYGLIVGLILTSKN